MKKWNKKLFLITSFVVFLPMLAGFLLWDRLPDRLITHWNAAGEPDGSMGKPAAILVIPLFLMVMHLFCLVVTHLDKRNDTQSPKALLLVYWAMPVTSLFSGGMVLGNALTEQLRVPNLLNLLLGLLFMIIGNYLPKCRPNGTLGIRLPWTLADAENWQKTHRFGGRIWLPGGAALMLGAFLSESIQLPFLLAVLFLLLCPVAVYSFRLHKKKQQQ